MPALAAGLASALSYVVPFITGTAAAKFSFLALGKAFLVGVGLGLLFQALAPNSGGGAAYREQARRLEFSAVARRRHIIGRVRCGGVVCHMEVTGTGKTKTLHMAIVLGDGPMDAIEAVWVEGKQIPTSRSRGVLRGTGDYQGRFACHEYLNATGTQGSAFHRATSARTSFRLNGVSWTYVALTQNNYTDPDDRLWKSARPRIEFVVRGLKFSTPHSSTPVWSRNAADVRYWFLKERMNVPDEVIDIPSYTAARAVCESTVTTPLPTGPQYSSYEGSDLRYAVDGVIFSDEENQGLIEELDKCWAGNMVEHSGIFHFRPGANRVPVDHFGAEDIIESGDFIASVPLPERIGSATAKCAQSAPHDFQPYQLPVVKNQSAINADGREYRADFGQYRFVCNPITAQRLVANAIERSRQGQSYQYVVFPGIGFSRSRIVPSDIITVTDERNGLENARMEVQQTVWQPDMSWAITVRAAPEFTETDHTAIPAPIYD